jgi:glycosyltransferase involved in cell wall biosynthesis
VYDEYEGFDAKTFADLTTEELNDYIDRNVTALRTAVAWHRSEIVITGHVVPGGEIGRRAMGDGGFVTMIHGSDIEYAVKLQDRYSAMATDALEGALGVVGSSRDVLERTMRFTQGIRDRMWVAHPGVDVERFALRQREASLTHVSTLLETDPDTARGRPTGLEKEVRGALTSRDARTIDRLALRYDQMSPDPGTSKVLRSLAAHEGPMVGYLGKLIPQKGVERVIETMALLDPDVRALVVGFGTHREWLTALVEALTAGDAASHLWLRNNSTMRLELDEGAVSAAADIGSRISFTGRLDHRYAPHILAAFDILVVPSTLPEAFGMVAAEGAAAGALPLVARHSGLAEVASTLEGEVGRPGLFSFEPGDGATRRVAEGVRALLGLAPQEREELRSAISGYVKREWSWEATARNVLLATGTR